MARHFVERARREARRRPLAAIRHTQRFNIFAEHTNKCDSSKGSGVSHRGSTTSRAGLRSEHESDDTRRGEWRTNGRADALPGEGIRGRGEGRRAPARRGERRLLAMDDGGSLRLLFCGEEGGAGA
jgi:hypothetical protein